MSASWKTTVAGASAILLTLGGVADQVARIPGDTVQWSQIIPLLIVALATVANAIGNMLARDNNVTSEQALSDPNASAKAAAELRSAGIK